MRRKNIPPEAREEVESAISSIRLHAKFRAERLPQIGPVAGPHALNGRAESSAGPRLLPCGVVLWRGLGSSAVPDLVGHAQLVRSSVARRVLWRADISVCTIKWDQNKNRSNRAKHGIGFDTAIGVFRGPERDHATGYGDRRRTTVANDRVPGRRHDGCGSYPGRRGGLADDVLIRVISARKATPRERRLYEEGDYSP